MNCPPGSNIASRACDGVGSVYRDLHADHGLELHLETSVAAFVGGQRIEGVRTVAGEVIECDLVVVGIGVEPRVELATTAGLGLDNGIAVDEHLRTSAPGVYAAGDMAAVWHPGLGRRIRFEHWANALNQGFVAAKKILGVPTVYDRIPYFYSDQYDLGMEYAGYATGWDQVVFRCEPSGRAFIAFWLEDGRVVAGMNANIWEVNDAIKSPIGSRRSIPSSSSPTRTFPSMNLWLPHEPDPCCTPATAGAHGSTTCSPGAPYLRTQVASSLERARTVTSA